MKKIKYSLIVIGLSLTGSVFANEESGPKSKVICSHYSPMYTLESPDEMNEAIKVAEKEGFRQISAPAISLDRARVMCVTASKP